MTANNLKVDVHHAIEANVNSYVFSDDKGTFIIDCTRNSEEARKVAALARSKGADPETILITHGHPDHYLGMGAILQEFPNIRFVVASQGVKDDIIGFTQWMDSVNWLEGEPHMKSKSDQNPDGFDYEGRLEVLQSSTLQLPGGGVLQIKSDYPPTECAHMTTVFAEDLNALFTIDLTYNKVHIWMGVGVAREHINNWQEQLDKLKEQYGPLNATIYPGHGNPTDVSIFDIDKKYMNDLLDTIEASKSEDEAKQKMMQLYPDWENTDFLLMHSVKNQFELANK
ncbi:MBL fold metallo-hydrolase [Paenibacillus agilis]|uniref:MBL fold metallo-hydrolase n=1 Tax=Paenibacillus agilis TaxID=3020863 RepID=UPI00164982D3|nr:MBL fold metallo-hydrolase [Paenibacillus agilis]